MNDQGNLKDSELEVIDGLGKDRSNINTLLLTEYNAPS